MIKLELICTPDELAAHMAALGFTPHPFDVKRPSELAKVYSCPGEKAADGGSLNYARDLVSKYGRFHPYVLARVNIGDLEVIDKDLAEGRLVEAAPAPGLVPADWREGVKFANIDTSSAESEAPSWSETAEAELAIVETQRVEAVAAPVAGLREPGKPKYGSKRRTPAEVAEDEAYFASIPPRTEHIVIGGDVAEVEATSNISSGEERVDPSADQDAEDEHAETLATQGTKLTRDALRAAHGRYAHAFGMVAATKDVRTLIGGAIADIPETPEALTEAIAKIDAAIAAKSGNSLGSFIAETTKQAEAELAGSLFGDTTPIATATREDAFAALRRYGMKFDGEANDPANMPITIADSQVILAKLFGEGVPTVGKVPPSPENYAKIVTAFDEAIRLNTYKRVAKS